MTSKIFDKYTTLFITLTTLCAVAIVWDSTAPLMSGDDIEFMCLLICF